MDQTAIHAGSPPGPPPDTAIQAGPPPGSPQTGPRRAPKNFALRALEMLADLRITILLFVLALILVFWGTLAQTDNGNWTVVRKYFRSYTYVQVPLKVVFFNAIENTEDWIPFPGGWLIGGVMMINLLAAHVVRFKLSWTRSGIFLIHAGLIVMMLGELMTGLYAVEGNMQIKVGQTGNTVTQGGASELAIIRTHDDDVKKDDVVTIPSRLLKPSTVIDHPDVPFKIEVLEYMVNSDLKHAPGNKRVTRGFGLQHVAVDMPEVNGIDDNQRFDAPSMYAKLSTRDGKALGTWLFSTHFENPQWIELDGKKYQVALRFKQTTRNFNLHLNKFTHDVFPGTEKPKDFHSYIRLTDPEDGTDRDVEIYMNSPLYYRGETFYQSSWTTEERMAADGSFKKVANGTILQVVRNPGWLMPYISCIVVGLGMLVHFGITLYRFVDRRIIR